MREKLTLLFKNPEKFFRLVIERLDVRGKISPIKRAEYKKRFSMTLADWIIHHQNEIATKQVTWMGIPIWKNVMDLHVYQEIIFNQSPDVIVEIGSACGGSALYFANLCDILNKGVVVSIDVSRENYLARHDRIIELTGKSADSEVIRKVHEIAKGKNVLVIQDGDHSKQGVLADLRNYAELVPVDGYFIVEDSISDVFNPGNGVGRLIDGSMCAIEQFLEENKKFVIDESMEKYLLTQNPKGYLKRTI